MTNEVQTSDICNVLFIFCFQRIYVLRKTRSLQPDPITRDKIQISVIVACLCYPTWIFIFCFLQRYHQKCAGVTNSGDLFYIHNCPKCASTSHTYGYVKHNFPIVSLFILTFVLVRYFLFYEANRVCALVARRVNHENNSTFLQNKNKHK